MSQLPTAPAGTGSSLLSGAVVCATWHDWPTHFCHDSCILAKQLLDPLFTVLAYPSFANAGTDLYVELFEWLLLAGGRSKQRLAAGYFSSHGDPVGEGLRDGAKTLFFDRMTARLFDHSILILAVCLGDGSFAKTLVKKEPASVRAVLGYEPELFVPTIRDWHMTDPAICKQFQALFHQALVQPLQSLTSNPACTIKQAYLETLRAWGKAVSNPALHKEWRNLAGLNTTTLTLYGDAAATL